jgi:hypothetical protein
MQATVLIPTRNRPQMLQRAIASVLTQEVSAIAEIIVSDNSTDDDSQAVVAGFRHPKLRYERYRLQSNDSLQRMRDFYKLATGEFCAILHDDDWWHPGLLVESLRSLQLHPEASLCGSSYLSWQESRGNTRAEAASTCLLLEMVGGKATEPRVVMRRDDILAGCAMACFVHYSTMVMRRSYTEQLHQILKPELFIFDTDRLHSMLAAELGSVVFNTTPLATIHQHDQQDSAIRGKQAAQLAKPVSALLAQRIAQADSSAIISTIRRMHRLALADSMSPIARVLHGAQRWLPLHPDLERQVPEYAQLLATQTRRTPLLSRIRRLLFKR